MGGERRWTAEQVVALAPDASAQRAARTVANPDSWAGTGWSAEGVGALWGECAGSGSRPYRACVDLNGPAYRCSCPSRKFPCKHALGLLLLWSADRVASIGEPPDWAAEWLRTRRERADKRAEKPARPAQPADPAATHRRAAARDERVSAGMAELDRWLEDRVRAGLADLLSDPGRPAEEMGRRMIDAQAPGAARILDRLGRHPPQPDRPARILADLALLHLLARAQRRLDSLPEALRPTVLSRLGYPLSKDEVAAGPTVRDHWDVVGGRDIDGDRLTERRIWLRARRTGRYALVLSFAAPGQPLDASLVIGTAIDADLAFYPGAAPLRALVATRHGTAVASGTPAGQTIEESVVGYAGALAADPWIERWPVVLNRVTPARVDGRWLLADADGTALPVHERAGDPWRLVAVSGGNPVTVCGEWTPTGLWPLTVWDSDDRAVTL